VKFEILNKCGKFEILNNLARKLFRVWLGLVYMYDICWGSCGTNTSGE